MARLGRTAAITACLAVLASPATWAVGKCERLVATGSPDAPPYSWQDPQDPRHLVGASVDLLRQVAGEIGVSVEVLHAGKRGQAFEEVRSGRMDLLLDSPMASSRLTALDYVHPPLQHDDYLVWTRHDAPLVHDSPAELQRYRGSLPGNARLTAGFQATLQAWPTLETAQSLTQAYQKLVLGQVDYVLAGRYAGMAMVQGLGLSDEVIANGLPVDRPGLFLAVSHNSACNDAWLRGQLARRVAELAGGTAADAALQRNLARWMRQARMQAQGTASDN